MVVGILFNSSISIKKFKLCTIFKNWSELRVYLVWKSLFINIFQNNIILNWFCLYMWQIELVMEMMKLACWFEVGIYIVIMPNLYLNFWLFNSNTDWLFYTLHLLNCICGHFFVTIFFSLQSYNPFKHLLLLADINLLQLEQLC